MTEQRQPLPTIDHAGFLADAAAPPAYLTDGAPAVARYSCAYCGVGDSGAAETEPVAPPTREPTEGEGTLTVERDGQRLVCAARLHPGGLHVEAAVAITEPGANVVGTLDIGGQQRPVIATEQAREVVGDRVHHVLTLQEPAVSAARTTIGERSPTAGCVKLKISLGQQRTVFPIHIAPSVLEPDGGRRSVTYAEAIGRLVALLLEHRPLHGRRTLLYACGQVDYFAIFAAQEVLRLLGVRNLAGNAEHCLNAGAVHNELLTGQEGPFLTVDQGLDGPGRMYLLNGWNGLLTHPPAFHRILRRKDLDAYLVEVAETESARALATKLGEERVLLVRSGGDPQLALAVAHELLRRHEHAVDERFVRRYADTESFERYTALAAEARFAPEVVAERITPEPGLAPRLLAGIRGIAERLADPEVVPVNIPSVGLSQTKGAVAHALWGSALALVGKYGLRPDGTPAGGTLRLPGQINAQTEVQGLSRRAFMGRIRLDDEGAVEAARRMGLPDDAYRACRADSPRAALDYSDPTDEAELFLFFGTQFESNMMERSRWVEKLADPRNRLVVVDPVPDPFALAHADLVIPSPPHAAAGKLYQNGEWRLTLSVPRKRAPEQTRTDATILYDAMAEVSRRLRSDEALAALHPDLAVHVASGYLQERFEDATAGGGLPRVDGEVSRRHLWERVLAYMSGGRGPLYCRPEHADGAAVRWDELLDRGAIVYGGVGSTRFVLDYDDPAHVPFRDIFREPRGFRFFMPTEDDLALPQGVILNSGRSTMSDDRERIRFATATFNSGKATPATGMPDDNPLYVSVALAARLGLATGNHVRVANRETGASLVLPVVVSDRVKGDAVYVSFHKSRAELDAGRYLNTVTSHTGRCPYTSQSSFKATVVDVEPVTADEGAPDAEPVAREVLT